MTIRLYLDEDSMFRHVLRPLRERAVDVETTTEAGMLERTDEEQLDYAASQQRVTVTSNIQDFSRLHRRYLENGRTHAGIVLIQQAKDPIGEIIRGLLALVARKTPNEMRDQLVYLSELRNWRLS